MPTRQVGTDRVDVAPSVAKDQDALGMTLVASLRCAAGRCPTRYHACFDKASRAARLFLSAPQASALWIRRELGWCRCTPERR